MIGLQVRQKQPLPGREQGSWELDLEVAAVVALGNGVEKA